MNENGKLALSESFGSLTFNKGAMAKHLSKATYQKLLAVIENGEKLEVEIADEVAHGMKEWALTLGATHFCHWFQPHRGVTAEKHDAFLGFDESGEPIERFSGRQLIQGEPDASSFPSGGMRSTFEARGYTAWDPTSPAFILQSGQAATLVIPSVYLSWTGEVLDMKTPLLRALRAVEDRAFRVLKLFGNRTAKHVRVTIGPEQEYFLIAKELYNRRPDLIYCGRTLFGAASAKQQQLEDHYFGSIKAKVLDFMTDLDANLFDRGIPAKTRHNEVAPNQFEIAPIYEKANLAIDHNLQLMEIMRQVADKHGLALLLHEKPFAGINGSGKHMNWSMVDSDGRNLLEPGATPKKNVQFLAFLAAILAGVDKYGGLLRATVADAGNDHRLGANEAPPAIMSLYLGAYLDRLLGEIEKGSFDKLETPEAMSRELIKSLPSIVLDNSDRNRTSPVAFTGNKFEFRAAGSSQSVAEPATALCLAVAHGLDRILERLEKFDGKVADIAPKALAVVRDMVKETKRIRFEGNNYTSEWHDEAARRGLPNMRSTPEALDFFLDKDVMALYERYGVLTKAELKAKHEIKLETYIKLKEIEIRQLKELALTFAAPALARHINVYGQTTALMSGASKGAAGVLKAKLAGYGELVEKIYRSTDMADAVLAKSAATDDLPARARFLASKGVAALDAMRAACDGIEEAVDQQLWLLPKYREMLFLL
ncbi:MAG TPA: glutamine synthetase type III [Elusimicrobia bacterium]|nr:glutamine synthetase type III [Elusimicrobiota bacterium]HBT60179.1 glutamine synthetase type III [Elusimicrobiota bacterium]